MTPKKRPPQPKEDDDDDDQQDITIGNKNLNVKLSLSGRGIVLVYALALALLIGTIGWVAVQLITALKMTKNMIPETVGLIVWTGLASLSAYLSRFPR